MSIFFFLVGLEIKRELLIGELSSFKQAAFPFSVDNPNWKHHYCCLRKRGGTLVNISENILKYKTRYLTLLLVGAAGAIGVTSNFVARSVYAGNGGPDCGESQCEAGSQCYNPGACYPGDCNARCSEDGYWC
jgi:hypothetical protein